MNLKIGTAKLQEMVSRSIKGAGNNKLIPITSLVGITLNGGLLTLTTTDGTNYLYVHADDIDGEDFSITVPVDTFSNLSARMTCDSVSLELKDKCLLVNGNGKYSIELPLEEDGTFITYPNPVAGLKLKATSSITSATIADILNSVKPALAVTLEEPCYTGYWVGNSVVATDSWKAAQLDVQVLKKPKLISPEMMNLLSVTTAEKVDIYVKDNVLVFYTDDVTVYGSAMSGIEEYAIDSISQLFDVEFVSTCKIAKSQILQLLDRLALFVLPYDKNAVILTFAKDGLHVSSKASSGVETIEYIENTGHKDFVCEIDIDMLVTQIKGQTSDTVTIYYGLDNAIKMVDGNLTQIVALMYNTEG